MTTKERELPILLMNLMILLRRLSTSHPKYEQVSKDLKKRKAGYYGEQSLDYFLSLLPDTNADFQVLHDIRLPYKDGFFQIDTLLLFPSFFIILEVKNLAGTLLFDPDHHQLIQLKQSENGQIEKAIQDPILQVKRQYSQFQAWLKINKFPQIPGEALVVLANSNAIVKAISNPKLVQEMVVKNTALSFKIERLLEKYTSTKWNKKVLKKAAVWIRKKAVPLNPNLLESYGIPQSELLTGVFCPECDQLAMERLNGRWKCPSCHRISKDAHLQALFDYGHLISKTITVKEACEFLHMKNLHNTRRLIKSMGLNSEGQTFSKKYYLS